MLSIILNTQRKQFEALAEVWLADGARTFSVWQDEQTLAKWPADKAPEEGEVIAPIQVGKVRVGELHLTGINGSQTKQRLGVEAAWIGQLIKVENEMDSMTEELVESQDQLLALYNLTQSTRNHLDLDQTFKSLTKEVRRLVKAEGALLALERDVAPLIVEQHPSMALDEATVQYFFERLHASGNDELLLDREDAPTIVPPGVTSLFLIPIPIQGDALVILGFLLNQPIISLSPTLKLARAMAEHVGAQIENLLLYQDSLEQTKLKTELELAADIQLRLLPQSTPQVPGVALAASSRPARHVGGDFYDFISQKDSPFTFLVGDVSGKGTGAALLMAMTRSVVRSKIISKPVPTPEMVMSYATEVMYDDFSEVEMFVSMLIGQYDPETRCLRYANAGHSPVIYCPAGGPAQMLEADGPVMGVLPLNMSEEASLTFEPGDLFVVATDGFSEANNVAGTMFGYDEFLGLVQSVADKSAEEILQILYQTIDEFSGDAPQTDDQTLIVVKGVMI